MSRRRLGGDSRKCAVWEIPLIKDIRGQHVLARDREEIRMCMLKRQSYWAGMMFGVVLAVCGCRQGGSSADEPFTTAITVPGMNKPFAVMFDPLPQDKEVEIRVMAMGRNVKSFVVEANSESEALAMFDANNLTTRPGSRVLATIDHQEDATITVPVSANTRIGVLGFVSNKPRKGEPSEVDVIVSHRVK